MIEKMTGYKATDKKLKCQGFQFEVGKWYEHEGDVVMCRSGFHFCKYPSGPYRFYPLDSRIFEVEAEDVIEKPDGDGAEVKFVARRIRLVKEITPGGTGYGNTGNGNTGYGNTGNGNTGYGNTGNGNTGYRNTGDRNTGYRNTGYRNTGNGNTGDGNTGNGNTGYGNTGNGNTGDFHAGFLNSRPEPVVIFNLPTSVRRENLDFWQICRLSEFLMSDDPFDYKDPAWMKIPNATPSRIRALHKAHIKARAEMKKQ